VTAPFRRELRPAPMCASRQPVAHIELVHDEFSHDLALDAADLILCWRDFDEAEARFGAQARVFNVATDDLEAAEYGTYCKVHWALLGPAQRRRMLEEHRQRFLAVAAEIRATRPRAAVVCGTGPSIDRAYEFDFSGLFTVVCNSTVQSDALLAHIRPRFICAGDVVSHLGVSTYAARFREDLVVALRKFDCHFLTTAQFGWLLLLQHPEAADRIFLCDQGTEGPAYDLVRSWSLPKLDSTLNIHMLPLAATFCDRIYILGCDGKNPDPQKNEDFWAHSTAAQYHDLVQTGHLCHPTFDLRRKKNMHERYVDSVAGSLQLGEAQHGKSYHSLVPSFTPSVRDRLAPPDLFTVTPEGRKRPQ